MTIFPDQTKTYQSYQSAIEDNGFTRIGTGQQKHPVTGKWHTLDVYQKKANKKYYSFEGGESHNGTIYNVEMKPIPKSKDAYVKSAKFHGC